MKKLFAVILAAMLTLSLAACSNKEDEKPEEVAPNTPVETPAEEEKEETPAEEESEEIVEEEVEEVDYSTELSEWLYQPESDDEAMQAFVAIDACEYGTAGASLKQTNAAVQLLKLTAMENMEEALTEYLEGMNPTQKDYFSFQWQMNVKAAEVLLADPAAQEALLADSGNADVDLSLYTAEAIDTLNETVTLALEEAGVKDVWKEHLDIEPFTNWEESEALGETMA